MKLTQMPRTSCSIYRESAHTILKFHSDEVGPVTIRLDPLCLPTPDRFSGVYFGSSPLQIEPTTTFLGERPKGSRPDDAPLHSYYEPPRIPVHLMPEDDSQPHKFISLFILLLIVSASIIGVWLL